jgi:hypothetical protein
MKNKSIISSITFLLISIFYVVSASAGPTKPSDCGPNEIYSYGSWGQPSTCTYFNPNAPPKKSYPREKKCASKNIGKAPRREQERTCARIKNKKACAQEAVLQSDSIFALPFTFGGNGGGLGSVNNRQERSYLMCSWE